MNKKIDIVKSLGLVALVSTSLLSCGEAEEAGARQKDAQVESFSKNVGNARSYNPSYFKNPNNVYRVLPVNNSSPMVAGGASTSMVDTYAEQGYGGLVTNVAWGDGYLTSEQAWENLEEVVKHAIEDKGLRVMIYDEDVYPSGGARTTTLKATPEGENWEAQGLVSQLLEVEKDTPTEIPVLHGHTLQSSYFIQGNKINDFKASSYKKLSLKEGDSYTPEEDGSLILIYHKQWYEGTHFQYNLLESRRYIDLLQEAPIQEFLRNTYDAYYEHLGEYFGKGIEATFMDEPSMPGFYFTPTTARQIDEADSTIPLLPAVNYSHTLPAKFKAKYNYELEPNLPYLFAKGDENEEVRRFRWDYYELLSELMSSNLTGQIQSWTREHNVLNSGHFLAEESLSTNVLLSGDIIQEYHYQDMPGIDLTYADIDTVLRVTATTGKHAVSAADFDSKQRVFAEVGQDQGEASDGINQNLAGIAALQSIGVNYLTSYFRFTGDEDNLAFAEQSARINYMLDGNVSEKELGVYYPVESVYASTTPYNSNDQRIYTGEWGFNNEVTTVSDNYASLLTGLLKNRIDYHVFDYLDLPKCSLENGCIVTPNGERYKAFLLPSLTALDLDVARFLKRASEAGVEVIIQNPDEYLARSKEDQSEMADLCSYFAKNCTKVNGDSGTVISALLKDHDGLQTVKLSIAATDVIARKQANENSTLYMLVNTSNRPKSFTLECPEVGKKYREWDVATGEVNGMSVTTSENGSKLRVTLAAYGVGIYTIE